MFNVWNAIRRFVAWYVAHREAESAHNEDTIARGRVIIAERRFEWGQVTAGHLLAYLRYGIDNTAQRGNDFAMVRAMYNWATWGMELLDFDPQVALQIATVRAPVMRRAWPCAVSTPKADHSTRTSNI